MYIFTLPLHSLFRWLVVCSLLLSVSRACYGLLRKQVFTAGDNRLRHWTATIAHSQLLLGMAVYVQSPVVKSSIAYPGSGWISEVLFFRIVHIALMLTATVLVTIGSAKAKRMESSQAKFRTLLHWFSLALLIILVAIPWPFSPLARRPLLRPF